MADYTADDLCRTAQAAGFATSKRLVIDWASLGLLDQPTRRGLGRGKGTIATWPDSQCKLFLALLEKRRSVERVAPLCNIPVWIWLWWGDAFVPLRQVRRALRTWGESAGSALWGKARAKARRLVADISNQRSRRRDRQALVDALATQLYNTAVNPDDIAPLVSRVLDPDGTGQPIGPVGGQLNADRYVQLIQTRTQALARLETIPESLFEWARFTYLIQHQQYAVDQARLAADPDLGTLFQPRDLEVIANQACLDLVSLLGLGLQAPPAQESTSLEHPNTWRDHHLAMDLQTREVPGGLDVSLEVKPKT
jgi:hypothetical protein